MWFMLKELFSGSTDLKVAIFKVPQISNHLSAMLRRMLYLQSQWMDFKI